MKKSNIKNFLLEVEHLINLRKHILLRTELSYFVSDCIDSISFLTKKFEVVVISFEWNNIKDKVIVGEGNVDRIHLVQCMLSDSFQEIEFSLYKTLESVDKKKAVILFISPRNFINKNTDETVVFFSGFVKRIELMNIPLITLMHTSTNLSLIETISSNSYKILSIRNG